jgi:hypothetical protein
MSNISERPATTIDGVDYFIGDLSDNAKSQVQHIQFSEAQILQLQNELAISNTARNGYIKALKTELGDKPRN